MTPEELRTAQELFRAVMDAPPRTDRVAIIADAIRAQRTAAESSALERAAQIVEQTTSRYYSGVPADAIIKIRALIPPAAAPDKPPGLHPNNPVGPERSTPERGRSSGGAPSHSTPGDVRCEKCGGWRFEPWVLQCRCEPVPVLAAAPAAAKTDAPNGPVCGCGRPSRYESGWCGETSCFALAAETGKAQKPTPRIANYATGSFMHQEPAMWRVGNHYGIHVYEDQRPVATFHSEEDARRCVDAVNAGKAQGAEARKAQAWTDAIGYCEEMFSPEWLADPRNRSIFAAHIYRLLNAARAAPPEREGKT